MKNLEQFNAHITQFLKVLKEHISKYSIYFTKLIIIKNYILKSFDPIKRYIPLIITRNPVIVSIIIVILIISISLTISSVPVSQAVSADLVYYKIERPTYKIEQPVVEIKSTSAPKEIEETKQDIKLEPKETAEIKKETDSKETEEKQTQDPNLETTPTNSEDYLKLFNSVFDKHLIKKETKE